MFCTIFSQLFLSSAQYTQLCGNQLPGFIIDIHTGKPVGKTAWHPICQAKQLCNTIHAAPILNSPNQWAPNEDSYNQDTPIQNLPPRDTRREGGDWDHTLCRALVLLKQSPWLLGTILDGSPLRYSIPACWHSFCRPRKDDKSS